MIQFGGQPLIEGRFPAQRDEGSLGSLSVNFEIRGYESQRADYCSPSFERVSLESIPPEDAVEWYLTDREDELSMESRRSIRSGLDVFLERTTEAGIEDMNAIGGRELQRYKTWRKKTHGITSVSLNGTLAVLRRFLVFAVRIDAVGENAPEKVPMPNVPEELEVSYEKPSDELVERVQEYYERYEYASRSHVEFKVLIETGIRLGALRAIDLEDYRADDNVIELHHRPESWDVHGTPLKNKSDGARVINVPPTLCDTISAYINDRRDDVVDKFDHRPLFTTSNGRVTRSQIRRDLYKITRPCVTTNSCPHNKTIDDCEAANNRMAYKCESSLSSHPLRRWSIEHQLDQSVPKDILSDRVDVLAPVLTKHYDMRSEERKAKHRREIFEERMSQYSSK